MQRVEVLNLLARQNGDLFTLVTLSQQAYQRRERELGDLEEQQGTLVAQLGRQRAQIEQLVGDTKRLLAQAQAAERARQAARQQAQAAARQRAMAAQQAAAPQRAQAATSNKPAPAKPPSPTPPTPPPAPTPRPPPPVSGSGSGATAVRFALAQVGKPYIYGATGPHAWDCSSLMRAAWRRAGVNFSRTTYTQVRQGTPVALASLAAGDLVFTPGVDGDAANPGHVGMYAGHGYVIQATRTATTSASPR
jgi:cell wall-associated NlpC family hydrolase